MLLLIIGLDEFVMFSEPVILPPMVAFVMLVVLVSVFCAFTDTYSAREPLASMMSYR